MDVRLRRIELDDADAVHSWARLPEASRYQVWGPNTEEQTRAFVECAVADWSKRPQTRFSYVAVLDGAVVGAGELKVESWKHRQAMLSYIVHPDRWGRGVGTAIGRELLRLGFEEQQLHRVYATCDPRNVGSERILTKLGMTYEGQQREVQLIQNGWRDSKYYSMLETEWPLTGGRSAGEPAGHSDR